MFEQSLVDIEGRRWTMAASLMLQSATAAVIVIISIWSIDALPGMSFPAPLPPLPKAPRPVEIVASQLRGRTASNGPVLPSRIFREPAHIPRRVALLNDEQNTGSIVPINPGLTGTGLPDGIYLGGNSRVLESLHHAPPPAQSQPEVKPKQPQTLRLGGHVLEGKLVRRVVPEYPTLARSMRLSGTVSLQGTIAREGSVKDLKVLSGHPLLVQAALAAVRQWLYAPTLLNGEPVEVSAPIQVHFRLDGSR